MKLSRQVVQAVRAFALACFVVVSFGASTAAFAAEPPTVGQGKVSINSADAEALAATLEGIGASKAQAIVDWRESNGQFRSIDDLANVKGVGSATIDKNRDKLSL